MTIAQQIIEKLENSPSFRERRFRDRYLLEMVLAKNNINAMFVPSTQIGDVIKDYMSFERIWRDVLQEREDLRGEDWKDGKILDQKFQMEVLGKESGYHELKKIAV